METTILFTTAVFVKKYGQDTDAYFPQFSNYTFFMTLQTIAVTGASGHLGNVLCRQLLQKGYQVKALYQSDKTALDGLPVQLFQGAITDPVAIDAFLEGCTAVVHCAARISLDGDPDGKAFYTNTEGTKIVFQKAVAHQLRTFVQISSVHAVEEQPLELPFDENRPYKTKHSASYDYSKSVSEQYVLQQAQQQPIKVIVVRPSSIVGPYDFKPSPLGSALVDLYQGKIPVLPEGGYDFVDVRDVAASTIAALEHGENKQVYLLTGKYYTLFQLATIIRTTTGKKTPGIILPYRLLKLLLPLVALYSKITGAAPSFTREAIDTLKYSHRHMDAQKARQALQHHSRPLQASIHDFYQWHFSPNSFQR
jgi:dihydroflavonol-4-reductase